MSNSNSKLIPPRFLFRFAVEVHRCNALPPTSRFALGEEYRLPHLGELDGERLLADVRMAWSPAGLVWSVHVAGKSQLPWCRAGRLEDSDGLQVWIDTRAVANIHRASRFCHRYAFLPRGGGRTAEEPCADQLLINRARENARPIRPRELQVQSQVTAEGYRLVAFVPESALAGFDPQGFPRLGFTYALLDRERGLQTFSSGPEMPYEEDPSCWSEILLVD